MKKYYQPRGGKKGRFALRENTYRRMWYLIADYPYFKAVQRGRQDARTFSQYNKGGNCETEFANSRPEIHNAFANKTRMAEAVFEYDVEQEQCERYINAIEAAIEVVPPEYTEHIMSHIIERKRYKEMQLAVSERTIKLWVQRFIWQVAHNLGEA